MIIAIDFDGTVVSDKRAYDDLDSPLEFMPGAKEALYALKDAGHTLLLYSARANKALTGEDPSVDPLHRAGVRNRKQTPENQALNVARYEQMVRFCEEELPGIFDAIDDGVQGKPSAHIYIDDKAVMYGPLGWNWRQIAEIYGEEEV